MARATKDLDFTVMARPGLAEPEDVILEQLQEFGQLDLGDFFTYRIGEGTIDLDGAPYGGARYPVEAILGGRTFARFHLDIGIGDALTHPVEVVEARDWLAFAGIPPARVQIISKEQQFAEKLHAYTLPRTGPANSRVRDLVDMVLLIETGSLSLDKVRASVQSTFARRRTHQPPSAVAPPPAEWESPFQALAEECGLALDLSQAFRVLSA